MKIKILLILLFCLVCGSAGAQTIKDASYRTVAHIKSDGTVQDASYHTIGHANGIPLRWAALYFFFSR